MMKQVYRFLTIALTLLCLQSRLLANEPGTAPGEPVINLAARQIITANCPMEMRPISSLQVVKEWFPPSNAWPENGAKIFQRTDVLQYEWGLPKSGKQGALIRICLLRPPGVGPLISGAWQYEQWTEGVDLISDHFEDLSLLPMPPMPRAVGTFRVYDYNISDPNNKTKQSFGSATITEELMVELENTSPVSITGSVVAQWQKRKTTFALFEVTSTSKSEEITLGPGEIKILPLKLPQIWRPDPFVRVNYADLLGKPVWVDSKIGNQDQEDSGAPNEPPSPGF